MLLALTRGLVSKRGVSRLVGRVDFVKFKIRFKRTTFHVWAVIPMHGLVSRLASLARWFLHVAFTFVAAILMILWHLSERNHGGFLYGTCLSVATDILETGLMLNITHLYLMNNRCGLWYIFLYHFRLSRKVLKIAHLLRLGFELETHWSHIILVVDCNQMSWNRLVSSKAIHLAKCSILTGSSTIVSQLRVLKIQKLI